MSIGFESPDVALRKLRERLRAMSDIAVKLSLITVTFHRQYIDTQAQFASLSGTVNLSAQVVLVYFVPAWVV